MDLSGFATKDTADEGVVLPVRIGGTKIPMAVKVYGSDSDAVREYERERIRRLRLGRRGKQDLTDDDIEELLDSQDEGVVVRIGGVWSYDWKKGCVVEDDPVELFGRRIGCDRQSYEFLVEKMPALKDWVMECSNDRGNFLSRGRKS